MSLVVKTKDASQLMDTDLDELASMGGSFGIGAISKAKEDWVLFASARLDNKLQGFMFSTLERIGGTPCVLLGMLSVKPTSKRDQILKGLMSDGSPTTRNMLTTSLDAMASGGMYDHLGGGFSRYSVDEKWLVPHFEKMLYDQALLVRVYTHAAVVFDQPRWRQVVEETIEYLLRDLQHNNGGFFSAQDADSLDDMGHSHEGHFYVFTPAQV